MHKVYYSFFVLAGLCCFSDWSSAQIIANATDTVNRVHALKAEKTKPPKSANSEWSLGFKINTNGWSGLLDIGKSKPIDTKLPERFYKVHVLHIEFSEKKSPMETPTSTNTTNATGNNNTFIFGKINNFYALKVGYGYRGMIAGKPNDAGVVSVYWVNNVGFSAGLLKPYYINVYGNQAISYSESTSSEFLNSMIITGNTGFFKGIGEIKFVPGFHYTTAFHFDFATSLRTILAIEAGLNAEYYSQPVQIMANIAPVPYFVDVFIGFQAGRRSNNSKNKSSKK
jgi:hypothetical protein